MNLDFSADQIEVLGLDLDDTLHFFKRASGTSADAVLAYVEEEFGIPRPKLRHDYSVALQDVQSRHFTDNLPATEYRERRFSSLLRINSILPHGHLDRMLGIYQNRLSRELTLKTGANELLTLAKSLGKKVVIVTEGPADAQRRALEELGLAAHVDKVFASSSFGCSKSTGLFERALQDLHCRASAMIFVGDNLERDYEASAAVGIRSILLDEARVYPMVSRRIENLTELFSWLEGSCSVHANRAFRANH